METACPDLPALMEASETVLAHAADCSRCRGFLKDLAELEEAPALDATAGEAVRRALVRKRGYWLPFAAAAALMLWAGLSMRPERPTSSLPAPATVVPASPFTSREEMILGQSAALTLKPGSRVRVEGSTAALLEGAIWLEDPGEPVTLKAAGASVEVEHGVLLLEMVASPRLGWLSQAWAGEGDRARLVVLSGSARVGDLMVGAGQELFLGEAAPRPMSSISWRGDAGWNRLDGLPKRIATGEHALGGPEKDGYAWEVLCRRVDPAAGASVNFVAGDRGWQAPLGVPWTEGRPIRLRVEVRGGWLRLAAGPYGIFHKPVADLAREGRLDEGRPFCGLRVWGGELEVLESRWKKLP